MEVLAQQPPRRIPPQVWQAARALAVTDGTMTLEQVARRFGLSAATVRKRSSRERWRRLEASELTPETKVQRVETEVPAPIVTLQDFRAALKTEVIQLLRLVREARLAPGRDPVKVARAAGAVLARLFRIGKQAFAEPSEPVKRRPYFHDENFVLPPRESQLETGSCSDTENQ